MIEDLGLKSELYSKYESLQDPIIVVCHEVILEDFILFYVITFSCLYSLS